MDVKICIISLCLLFTSCGKSSFDQEVVILKNPNLEYFGFTLIDVFFDDPSDDTDKVSYLNEVASFTNLADILVFGPQHDISGNLRAMDELNVKAFLHLHDLFFELGDEGGDKSGFIYKLRSDYKERWFEFIGTNDLENQISYIKAFYIGEEPTWNGITKQDLEAACQLLKTSFPNVKVMLIEAAPALTDLDIPESVDWVGFDHYFIKDPFTNSTYLNELDLLKSKMLKHQEIVVVLDSHYIALHHRINGIPKNKLDEVAMSYFELANSDTSVIALIGYFWPNGFESKNAIGARGMPKHVQEQYREIGRTITGK